MSHYQPVIYRTPMHRNTKQIILKMGDSGYSVPGVGGEASGGLEACLTQTTIAPLSRASCTSISIQDDLSRQMTGIREHFLRPVFMGCSTKQAKVIIIALGSLQRLIALRAAVCVEFSRILAYLPSYERPLVARCRHVPPGSPLPHHQLSHHSWQTTRKRT